MLACHERASQLASQAEISLQGKESLNRFPVHVVIPVFSAPADKMNETKFFGIKESIKKEYLLHIY